MQINTVPDYLPISKIQFLKHIYNVFRPNNTMPLYKNFYDYTQVYGYSCRSLFESLIVSLNKPDIKIAITPFHHTSFRDIIEKYIEPKNITIIQLNDRYNGIEKFPDIERCDILIITHIFGQDLIIDQESIEKFKGLHNCLIIEDRVQGGTLYKSFSHNYVDISIYSMGMDKRPVALGGGFVNIRNNYENIIKNIMDKICSYKLESRWDRFNFIIKKIPTFILYNNRFVLNILIKMVKICSYFNKSITLLKISEYYRKKNPGFSHNNYLIKPSNSLLYSIANNILNFKQLEKRYENQYQKYIELVSEKNIEIFYPWKHRANLLTAYNPIYIPDNNINKFLNYVNDKNICILVNPTYKIFNFDYENRDKNKEFIDNILYLPSIANMNDKEMKYLSNILDEYIR